MVSGDARYGTDSALGRVAPPSLLADDLAEFWADVAGRLERNGDGWRGQVSLSSLTSHARGVLLALVGTPGRRTIDTGLLEQALVGLGVGGDLPEALATLGAPVSAVPQQRRDERARRADGRAVARESVSSWPEAWAPVWIDEVIGAGVLSGYGPDEALGVVGAVRRVLDAIDGADAGSSISRIDLAANVLGSSHALDPGTRMERATTRALGHLVAAATGDDLEAGEAAGVDRRSVVAVGGAPQPGERGRV